MKVSVVVPTRNNSSTLEDCIKSLKKQTMKAETIIVAPKNDSSLKIAKKYGCRWAEDRKNTIGNAYNTGTSAAKGSLVAFTDDDCTVEKTWLKSLVAEMEHEKLDVLGGDDIIDKKNSTEFQKAVFAIDLARTLNSPIYGSAACKRLRACNIIFRKSVLRKCNFNTGLKGLQEPELLHRLNKAGYTIKFNPAMKVFHTRRSNFSGLFKQIYRNGKAKIELIKLHRDMFSLGDKAAIAILLLIINLVVSLFVNVEPLRAIAIGTVVGLLVFFLLVPLYTAKKSGDLKYFPFLISINFVRVFAYVLGFGVGLKSFFSDKITS